MSGLQGTLASKSMRLNLLITSQSLARMTRFLNLFATSFQNTLMMFINFSLMGNYVTISQVVKVRVPELVQGECVL